jgi:hypothetical protein
MKPVKTLRRRTAVLREGELTFMRRVHECPQCRRSHALLDEELGLEPRERFSRGVRELVCWHTPRSSFEDAVETLAHCHGIAVSHSEAARLTHQEGARIAQAQEDRQERWCEPVKQDTPVFPPEIETDNLVLQLDGTVVLTRTGQEHKTVWCGRGFEAAARTDNGSGRPMLVESRYAAGAGTLEEFKHAFLALANRMGARGAKHIAALGDGAEPLWNLVRECIPNAVEIQDYWHVAEHLHGLAADLYGAQSGEKLAAANKWCDLLWEGRVDELIAELRALRQGKRGTKRKRISEEIGYLEKGKHRMDYARYRAEGWPIGSGAIEGACKHLVKQRFGITGARWRRDQIQDILALRLAQFNGEWDTHWHKQAA